MVVVEDKDVSVERNDAWSIVEFENDLVVDSILSDFGWLKGLKFDTFV